MSAASVVSEDGPTRSGRVSQGTKGLACPVAFWTLGFGKIAAGSHNCSCNLLSMSITCVCSKGEGGLLA